jgi:hypothetical protein
LYEILLFVVEPRYYNVNTTLAAPSYTSTNSGSVFIYRDTSAGGDWSTYVIDKYLRAPSITANANFGTAVAFDGTTLAVSATPSGATALDGQVFIYREASVDGNWSDVTLKDTITEPTAFATSSDYFGISLAISGRNLFIGEYGEDAVDESAAEGTATNNYGAVYAFYDAVGDGSGYPTTADKKLKQRDNSNAVAAVVNAQFGRSISYSGSTLAVGAPGGSGASVPGKAFVYTCTVTAGGAPCGPTANWSSASNTITAKVLTTTSPMNVPDTGLAEQYYGFSVAIDDDAVVVGAPSDRTPSEADNTGTTVIDLGAAYVWHSTNGNADWSAYSMVKKLKPRNVAGTLDTTAAYQFGYKVALLGPVVAVSESRPSSTVQPGVSMYKDSDGDADYSTGTLNFVEVIADPYHWVSGQGNRFGESIVLDNSPGYFNLAIGGWNESSAETAPGTDSEPGSGTAGYLSGSVYVFGP